MVELRREPYSDDARALSARQSSAPARPSSRNSSEEDTELLSARLSSSLGRSSPRSPSEALQPEPVPPPPKRVRVQRHPMVVAMKFLLTILIIGVVGTGGVVLFAKSQFDSASDVDVARSVTIGRGNGLGPIADDLVKTGIITSKWLFVFGVWLSNQQTSLKAGEYLIPAHASMRDIMDAMVTGKGILYSVTIPEGLTTQQIVERLKSEDVLVGDIARVPDEGTLLPETYKFTRGDTRENLLNRMQRERDRVLTDVWSRRAPDSPVTSPAELVVLASVVEKETALADERSRVAAVFINRLRLNMRLQSDPTVIYGLFKGAGKPSGFMLSRADLEAATPYNTYVIPRLPPGPIANPGRASLEAVANPSRTRDLFFVADGSGGHAFAESYEDHLRNVSRWRDISAGNKPGAAAAEAAAAEAAGAAPRPRVNNPATAPMALSPQPPAQTQPVPKPKPQ